MKVLMFKPSNPFSILLFLHNWKTACNSNGSSEGAAKWFFSHLVNEPVKTALSYLKSATEEYKTHKEGTLKTACQAVNYLLESYATDNVIAETEADIINFK